MTSPTKVASNQRNAAKSTGPRSRAGKSMAALNAITHGLSAQLTYDPETSARISEITDLILEGSPRTETTTSIARQAAEAQVMLERVREAKHLIWHEVASHTHIVKRGKYHDLNDPNEMNKLEDNIREGILGLMSIAPHLFSEPFLDDAEREAEIICMAVSKLLKLIRFERRAANQRDKALRALIDTALQSDPAE